MEGYLNLLIAHLEMYVFGHIVGFHSCPVGIISTLWLTVDNQFLWLDNSLIPGLDDCKFITL